MTLPPGTSNYPTVLDLVQAIVHNGHRITPEEKMGLRMVTSAAPFHTGPQRFPPAILSVLPPGIPAQLPSDEAHFVKRIYFDQQWHVGNTVRDYVDDLRDIFSSPDSSLVAYHQPQGYVVAAIGDNRVPAARLGALSERLIFTVYSVRHDSIITGYQVTDPNRLNLGGNPVWL